MRGRVNTDLYSGIAINAATEQGTVDDGIRIVAGDFIEYTYDELIFEYSQLNSYYGDNQIYDLSFLADDLFIANFGNIITLFTYSNDTITIIDQYTPASSYVDTWDRYNNNTFFLNMQAGGVDIVQVSSNAITLVKSYTHNSGVESLHYYSDVLAFGGASYNSGVSVFDCSDLQNITALSYFGTLPYDYVVERTQHKIYSLSSSYIRYDNHAILTITTIDDTTYEFVSTNIDLGFMNTSNSKTIEFFLLDVKVDEDGLPHIIFLVSRYISSDTEKMIDLVIVDDTENSYSPVFTKFVSSIITMDKSDTIKNCVKYSIDYNRSTIVLAEENEQKIHNIRYNSEWDFNNEKEIWSPYLADTYEIKSTSLDFGDASKSKHYVNIINGILRVGNNDSLISRYIVIGRSYYSSNYAKYGYSEFTVRGERIYYGFIDKVKPITVEGNTAGIACESKVAGEEIAIYAPVFYVPSPTPSFKPVPWSSANLQQIANMLTAFYNDEINIYDYWSIGEERTVDLSAIPARSPLDDTNIAQTVTFVLANKGGKELVTPINGHTECAFVIVQKEILQSVGAFNSQYDTNIISWNNCDRKPWCNNEYYDAVPQDLRLLVKQHKNNINVWNQTTRQWTDDVSYDYFTLPSEEEISSSNCFEFYKTEANRIKSYRNGSASNYYTRKVAYSSSTINQAYYIKNNGTSSFGSVRDKWGISVQTVI